MKIRIPLLIVGSVPDEKHKLRYGGTTVLMKNFLDFLEKNSIPFRFVQNNKFSNLKTGERRTKLNKLYFSINFFLKVWFCRVIMFNFSDSGTVFLYPILSKFSRFIGKKVVLRKFGGSLELFLANKSDRVISRTFSALRNTDLILVETKLGIQYLKEKIGPDVNIQWFPNTRNMCYLHKKSEDFKKRCVCMSHIKEEKGIDLLLQIATNMPSCYAFDLYGAIKEEKYKKIDFSKYNVNYHGQIPSEKVFETILKYDILLLPSYRDGYPGIILEALSVGLPVVASNVGGIPEIIRNNYNGFLVPPAEVNKFIGSIQTINVTNYPILSRNARLSFIENFESDKTNSRIIASISELCKY